MTLAEEEEDELELELLVSQELLVSVCEIFVTRAVNVLSVYVSTVNVACCPTLTLPISVSSTFALICLRERSAMRMMTVGLSDVATAIVPTVLGSPTTVPSIGAMMLVSDASDSACARAETAVS